MITMADKSCGKYLR